MTKRLAIALSALLLAMAAWGAALSTLPDDVFDYGHPTMSYTASPTVAVGEFGRPVQFPGATVTVGQPYDASNMYGCPAGPCPIITVPVLIVAGRSISTSSIETEAVGSDGSRLTVARSGIADLEVGMTHSTELLVWTRSDLLKSGLTLRISIGGAAVTWFQPTRP